MQEKKRLKILPGPPGPPGPPRPPRPPGPPGGILIEINVKL